LLPGLDSISEYLHSQPFQDQTSSSCLAFVEIMIHRDKRHGGNVCRNVHLEEYHRPTTGFILAGVSSDELVNIVPSPFGSVVLKDYFQLFIFTFMMYFGVLGNYDASVYGIPRSRSGRKRR